MSYTELLSPMYYNNREIVLEEQWEDAFYACGGCVLELENNCVKLISPPQDFTVCCPRGQSEMYIFKYAQDERIAEEV